MTPAQKLHYDKGYKEGYDEGRRKYMDYGFYGFAMGLITVVGMIWLFADDSVKSMEELATSICQHQNESLEYDSYEDGILKCKFKPVVEDIAVYNGIIVRVGDEG